MTNCTMGLPDKFAVKKIAGAFAAKDAENEDNVTEASRKPTIEGDETGIAAAKAEFQFKTGAKNLKLQVPNYIEE